MSLMKMTILSMEKWLNHENDSLFAEIDLPGGIDKDIMVQTILLRCAEFEVFYASLDRKSVV